MLSEYFDTKHICFLSRVNLKIGLVEEEVESSAICEVWQSWKKSMLPELTNSTLWLFISWLLHQLASPAQKESLGAWRKQWRWWWWWWHNDDDNDDDDRRWLLSCGDNRAVGKTSHKINSWCCLIFSNGITPEWWTWLKIIITSKVFFDSAGLACKEFV